MKRALKIAVGVSLLAGLFWLADPQALAAAVANLTPFSIGLLLAISFVLIFISAFKWKCFIEALGTTVSIWRLSNLYLLGYFVNTLLPSWIGGDVVRSWYIGKRIGQHDALAATILERVTGLVAMILLAFVVMWFSPLVTWQIQVAITVILIGVGCVIALALSPKALLLAARIPGMAVVVPHIQKVQAAFEIALARKRILWISLVLSVVFHLMAILNTAIAGWAVGWHTVPLLDLSVVVPLILLVGAIPVAPSGLGIQEGAFYFFLTGIGATPAQALAIGLVLRAKTYVLGALGWFSWQYERKFNREFVADALTNAGVRPEDIQ